MKLTRNIDGIFSGKSFENTEKLYDEIMGKCMREYWDAHPEEFERLTKKLDNGLKKLDKN